MIKKKIAIIDDEPINLNLIEFLLSDTYEVKAFDDAKAFMLELDNHKFDLMILDVFMPEINGYELIKIIKSYKHLKNVPVIFLSAQNSEVNEKQGLELGAVDYMFKPFSADILKARIKTHIMLSEALEKLQQQNQDLNFEVQKRVQDFKAIQDISLSIMAQIVEQRDLATGDHIQKTQKYVKIIATELSKSEKYERIIDTHLIDQITKASVLHDIGKVAIKDQILLKPGILSPEEFQEMKLHVKYGAMVIQYAIDLLKSNKTLNNLEHSDVIEFFEIAKDIAQYHHERYDGLGYLSNLEGENIPLAARIMAIADVFDALVTERVYKKAWSFEDAFLYILNQKGKHFDPDLVDAFSTAKEEIFELYERE